MDMITKLMQPQIVKNDDKAKIIEIESTTFVSGKNASSSSETLSKTTSPTLSTTFGYGFNSRHTHILAQNIGSEFPFLTKLDTLPSSVSHEIRRKNRVQEENEKFDEDR